MSMRLKKTETHCIQNIEHKKGCYQGGGGTHEFSILNVIMLPPPVHFTMATEHFIDDKEPLYMPWLLHRHDFLLFLLCYSIKFNTMHWFFNAWQETKWPVSRFTLFCLLLRTLSRLHQFALTWLLSTGLHGFNVRFHNCHHFIILCLLFI